ncbi:MAG: hypothetical protein PHR14_10595, partial [Oscillospiraceae bacterium]|nr:hypothetical protein [Oscillospiraceae bacterium]
MKNKSTICRFIVLLAAIAVSASLAGCGTPDPALADTDNTADTTSAPVETAEPELADLVPDLDYEGYDFVILSSATSSQHAYFSVNEATGDVFDDAMYARTQAISEKFNITIQDVIATDSNLALTMFRNSIQAGDAEYDIGMLLERRAFAITNEDLFLDQSGLEHVDLTRPYWQQDVNEIINLSPEYYLTYGDAVLPIYDMMHILLFNQKMTEDLSLESPYDLVLDGAWTYEKFKTMAKAAAHDADGDTKWTDNDVYGIIGGSNSISSAFITGARERTIEPDTDGIPVINLLENEKIYNLITVISTDFWEDGFYYKPTGNSNDYYIKDLLFQTDQALFADFTLYTVKFLRDMTSDFGIIPFPKYNEEQADYATMVEAGTRVTTVPVTAKHTELVGAVLETMHRLSRKDVMPAYYEITLRQKVSRDNISAQMLDLITDSVYYDLGNTMFNDSIKDGIFTVLFEAKGNREYV